jgi:hypothetical protein
MATESPTKTTATSAPRVVHDPNDPYGVAEERRQERERYAKMKAAAEARPKHDPRGQGYTDQQVEELVMQYSYAEGAKACGIALTVFGTAAYAANVLSPTFRTRLGPSGKMAMVIMPVLGITAVSMEWFIVGARRDRQGFLDRHLGFQPELDCDDGGEFDSSRLSVPKRFANLVYEYPYRTLFLSGAVAVGTVFSLQPKELSIQQRIFHSRVLGQMSVLGILCSVMGFMDFMRRNGGPFRE